MLCCRCWYRCQCERQCGCWCRRWCGCYMFLGGLVLFSVVGDFSGQATWTVLCTCLVDRTQCQFNMSERQPSNIRPITSLFQKRADQVGRQHCKISGIAALWIANTNSTLKILVSSCVWLTYSTFTPSWMWALSVLWQSDQTLTTQCHTYWNMHLCMAH